MVFIADMALINNAAQTHTVEYDSEAHYTPTEPKNE